jgi:hypothetical protein
MHRRWDASLKGFQQGTAGRLATRMVVITQQELTRRTCLGWPVIVSALLLLVTLTVVGCGANSRKQAAPSAAASTSPTAQAPVASYGPPPALVDSNSPGEAVLKPTNFHVECADDSCTVAGVIVNVGGHPRTQGKVTATLVDTPSRRVLSGCESGVHGLSPDESASISCQFNRRAQLTQPSANVEVRLEVSDIRYSL